MKSLEARVAYLEGLLQEARPEVALDHFSSFGEASPSREPKSPNTLSGFLTSAPRNTRAQNSQNDISGPEETNMYTPEAGGQASDILSSEVALLCLSAAGREPHFFGASSAVSFSRIVSATMGLEKSGSRTDSSQHSVADVRRTNNFLFETQSSHRVPIRFPTSEMKASLSEAYFRNIHPQYPFLHRPTFEKWENECWRAVADGTHLTVFRTCHYSQP